MNSLVLPDGVELFRRAWPAKGDCKAVLFLVHGLGEHSGRYQEFGSALSESGITVESIDLRGHGQSGGKRGHAGYAHEAVKDLAIWIREVEVPEGVPRFLMGHSLGGMLVAKLMLDEPAVAALFSGVILSSPALALSKPPPSWQVFVGKIAVRLLPWFRVNNKLDVGDLTRNQAEIEAYRQDPLVTDLVSLATVECMVDGIGEVGVWPSVRTLVLHGDADRVTCHETSKEFAAKIGAQFKSMPGVYHEPLHEIAEVKEETIQIYLNFLKQQQ